MLRSVFLKSLRDQVKPILFWGIGLILLAVLMAAFFPSVKESAADLNKYLENLPEALRNVIGSEELNYTTASGYLNSELFSFMFPLIYLIYAVSMGSGLIGGEESKGTLNLLLANPISRSRVVLEKFIALVVSTGAISLIAWEGIVLGAWLMKMDLNLLRVAEINFSAALLAIFFGSLALALSCVKSSRGFAVGLTVAIAIFSYFLNILSPLVDQIKDLRQLSPFYYYNENNPILNGLNWQHVAVFVGATFVLLLIGLFSFQRRDVGR